MSSNLFVSDRRGRPGRNPNRSADPEYGADLSKLNDVTLYNASSKNVNFYRSSPQRSGTPIKSPKARHQQQFYRMKDPQKELVKSLLPKEALEQGKRRALYTNLIEAPLRTGSCGPTVICHGKSGKSPFVINDDHSRETNPGYGRKENGNFYNHQAQLSFRKQMGCTSSSNTITVRYNNQSKCVEIDGLKTVADLKKVLASTYRIDSVDIKFQDNTLDPEMALAKAGVKAKSEVFAITNLNLGPANAGAGDPSQAQASSASVNCLDPSGNIESINFDWMNATVAEVKKIYSERTRIPMDSINFSFKNESMDNSKTMKECGVALGDNNQVIVKIN